MNVKEQVKLFENIIENEYRHIQKTEVEDIKSTEVEYGVHTEKKTKIMDELRKTLSSEMFEIVSELDDINVEMVCIEQRHYFKEGVKAGIDNLNFLSEYDSSMLL
ncbi:MAG: hypothetical protein RSE41_03920 [Clostridia bacterium]